MTQVFVRASSRAKAYIRGSSQSLRNARKFARKGTKIERADRAYHKTTVQAGVRGISVSKRRTAARAYAHRFK